MRPRSYCREAIENTEHSLDLENHILYSSEQISKVLVVMLERCGSFLRVFALVGFSMIVMHAVIQNAAASPTSDFYVQQAIDRYFSLPQDAKALSMGGADRMNCRDNACIYLNPAGLGFVHSTEFGLSIGTGRTKGDEFLTEERIEQLEERGYGVIAIPIGPNRPDPRYGTIALGYSRYTGNTDDSINTRPDGHRRSIGYGYAPLENFALGYSATFYDDQLHSDFADLHSHAQFLHNFGAQFEAAKGLTIASTFRLGIGQSDTEDFAFNSNGLSHPKRMTGGVSVAQQWEWFKGALAYDFSHYNSRGNLEEASSPVVIGSNEGGKEYNIRLGLEARVWRELRVRVGTRYEGANYEFKRDDLETLSGSVHGFRWSSGLGYVFKSDLLGGTQLRLDYGIEYGAAGTSELENLVSFTVAL